MISFGFGYTQSNGLTFSKPFLKTTHLMEGDGPTGCMVIPQYVELRNSLDKKIEPLSINDAIYPMIFKMKEKTEEYLNETLRCETLVMATLLHPFFRLKFFVKWFGARSAVTMQAESTFRRLYQEYAMSSPATKTRLSQTDTSRSSRLASMSSPKQEIFGSDSEEESEVNKANDLPLKNYLRGLDKMRANEYDVQAPETSLQW